MMHSHLGPSQSLTGACVHRFLHRHRPRHNFHRLLATHMSSLPTVPVLHTASAFNRRYSIDDGTEALSQFYVTLCERVSKGIPMPPAGHSVTTRHGFGHGNQPQTPYQAAGLPHEGPRFLPPSWRPTSVCWTRRLTAAIRGCCLTPCRC
jgi:hypothetical protein